MAFPAFHSREAVAVIGTGRTPAELRARSFASSPRTRSKKGPMMSHLPNLNSTDRMATLCPTTAPTPKAVNILKTKGLKTGFSPSKAVNILKISKLLETAGTPQKPDK
jgi:hypothetical protein